jgi:uncharacterized protein (DUF983 family)
MNQGCPRCESFSCFYKLRTLDSVEALCHKCGFEWTIEKEDHGEFFTTNRIGCSGKEVVNIKNDPCLIYENHGILK